MSVLYHTAALGRLQFHPRDGNPIISAAEQLPQLTKCTASYNACTTPICKPATFFNNQTKKSIKTSTSSHCSLISRKLQIVECTWAYQHSMKAVNNFSGFLIASINQRHASITGDLLR